MTIVSAGLCIGGPMMGQYLTRRGTSYHMAKRPNPPVAYSPDEYPDATVPLYQKGRYEFDGIAWWWIGWER
jgi:hypothetical protein